MLVLTESVLKLKDLNCIHVLTQAAQSKVVGGAGENQYNHMRLDGFVSLNS